MSIFQTFVPQYIYNGKLLEIYFTSIFFVLTNTYTTVCMLTLNISAHTNNSSLNLNKPLVCSSKCKTDNKEYKKIRFISIST